MVVDVVGFGELEDLVGELVVVDSTFSMGVTPTVESLVQLDQRGLLERAVRTPCAVDMTELGYQSQDLCVEVWGDFLVEVGLGVVGVQENQEEQLFVVIFLK